MAHKIHYTAKAALLRGLYLDLAVEGYHIWKNAKIPEPHTLVKRRKRKDVLRKLILLLEWAKRDWRRITEKMRHEN